MKNAVHPTRSASLGQRLVRPLLALAIAGIALSGCASDAPEPPPYPEVEKGYGQVSLRWQNGSGEEALPGFQPIVTASGLWVVDRDGEVRRLSLKDGREEKSFEIDTGAMAGMAADDTLVVLADRGGRVVARDHDGRERWATPLNSALATAPQLTTDAVLVRTIDGRVMALEHDTGAVRWTWKAPVALLNLWQSSPMLVDIDTVYVGLPSARLVALDLQYGVPRWETVISSTLGASELERLVDIVGSPVLRDDEVCAVAYQGRIACVRTDDGEIVWGRALGSASGMAADGEDLVVVDSNEVIQLLRPNGGTIWRQEGYVRRALTQPVIASGGRLLFGDRFGHLSVLSMEDGRTLARIEIDDTAFATPPVVADGTAYVQTLDGTIAAIALE